MVLFLGEWILLFFSFLSLAWGCARWISYKEDKRHGFFCDKITAVHTLLIGNLIISESVRNCKFFCAVY